MTADRHEQLAGESGRSADSPGGSGGVMKPGIITLTTDFGLSGPYVAAVKGVLLERADYLRVVEKVYEKANASLEGADFRMAKKQFDATRDLLDHFDKLDLRRSWPTWPRLPQTAKALLAKLRELHFGPDLEDVRARVRDKGHMAEMFAQTRVDADALFRAAERLVRVSAPHRAEAVHVLLTEWNISPFFSSEPWL